MECKWQIWGIFRHIFDRKNGRLVPVHPINHRGTFIRLIYVANCLRATFCYPEARRMTVITPWIKRMMCHDMNSCMDPTLSACNLCRSWFWETRKHSKHQPVHVYVTYFLVFWKQKSTILSLKACGESFLLYIVLSGGCIKSFMTLVWNISPKATREPYKQTLQTPVTNIIFFFYFIDMYKKCFIFYLLLKEKSTILSLRLQLPSNP